MTEQKPQDAPASNPPEERRALGPVISEREDDVVETEIEPFTGDSMEVMIDVAEHLEKYEKALNAIMNFIIKRTYPGDWVSHDKMGTPVEERTANMSGAAAERIARDLGVQESNRTKPKNLIEEKHPGHYTYECEGDFTFRGRTVHAIGRASTLNPFYSKRGEGVRDVKDIREEYIIRDAWRDCQKQGIKGLFGLRKIPLTKLAELGYDITKVKYVNFSEGGQGGKNDAAATAKPKQEKEVLRAQFTIQVLSPRKFGEKPIIDILTTTNEKYSWWGTALDSAEGKRLEAARKAGHLVVVDFVKNGNYRNIEGLVETVPQ